MPVVTPAMVGVAPLHEVAPAVWIMRLNCAYPGAGEVVPGGLLTPPTDTVGVTVPDAATVKAAPPLQLNSMKLGELPWTTEVGLGVRAPGVPHVVVRTAAAVVGTEGKWWVNSVVTAAAVPITETSNSATTHFAESLLGIFIDFPPVNAGSVTS
jgi:hypothetical protein